MRILEFLGAVLVLFSQVKLYGHLTVIIDVEVRMFVTEVVAFSLTYFYLYTAPSGYRSGKRQILYEAVLINNIYYRMNQFYLGFLFTLLSFYFTMS